ncbi:MAG TPA: hypothetical protein PLT45_08050 [Smithella sp.]|nr:hypothetical protein [Smithella sp.]
MKRRQIVLVPVLILSCFVLFSCSREEKELSSINPGLYEIHLNLKYAGQLLILKQRVRYNADGTFLATNFQNDVAYEELKGKYKVDNGELVSYENYQRLIIPDGEWKRQASASVKIRKIKENSYQYYFEYPNALARERFKGLGLTEGWKTYKRISD